MKMHDFRLTKLALLSGAAIASFCNMPALAQDQGEDALLVADKVVVTGVRASLARALDQKRNSNGIIDGISSEDLIDYPDLNIADSLQRITGVTVERNLGEATNIAVRGLASEFTQVTINGQTVVSGNNGREVDFDIFASELFNNVTVSKSHRAELTEGGLAGTVDLRTARPFDYRQEGPLFAVSLQGSRNDLVEETDPRVSGVFSTTTKDGTFGVLVSSSYSQQSFRQDNVEGLRWIQAALDLDGNGSRETTGVEYPFIPRYVNENISKDRLGVTTALQFRPTNNFEANLDVAYGEIEEERLRYSIDGLIQDGDVRTPLAPPVIDATGLLVEATLRDVESRSENIQTPIKDDLLLVNADASWDLADNLILSGRVGYSQASRTTEEFRSTWSSTGIFRYSLQDRIFIDFEGVDRNIFDPTSYNRHQARFINTFVDDEELSVQSDLEWRLAGPLSAIKAGVRFADREKATEQFDGQSTVTADFENFSLDLPVDNFFEGADSPNVIASWPVSNFSAVRGSTLLIPANFTIPRRLVATNAVTEETLGGYVQGDFDSDISSTMSLRGNVGLRALKTEQSSTGFPTNNTEITVTSDYTELLPSANFTLSLMDSFLVRFGAAKSLTRPTVSDLTPGGTVAVSVPNATFGNPELDPYTAWHYDISLEWYFAEEGLLSLAVFDKDVDGFVTRVSAPEILGADVLGASDPRAGTQFSVSRPVNGESAFVRGFELGLQAPLSAWVGDDSLLSGFGFVANYTFADSESEIRFNGQTFTTLLRGQSENSYNLIGYYETGPFSGRIAWSWRDSYLDEIRPSQTERSNFIDAYGQLDASIQYNLTEKISLTLDGLNLLGEEQFRYGERTDRNTRFSQTGRFVLAGVRAKF